MDEAAAAAKTICAASPNAASFALLPVLHGSTTQEIVVQHRRTFEDVLLAFFGCINLLHPWILDVKIVPSFYSLMTTVSGKLRSFDITEISVNYHATEHSGDRRKRNQACNLSKTYFHEFYAKFIHLPADTFLLTLGIMGYSTIHKSWGFANSRSLLGSIGPVSRARVCDLQNPDPDRPLSAPLRVPCFQTVTLKLEALFIIFR